MFDIAEILDLAIKIENNGEATYRRAVNEVSGRALTALLNWMADEEMRHARWFADLKAEIARGTAHPFLEEMGRELFADLIGEQSFSLKEVDFAAIPSADALVEAFIEFERDTIIFYEILIAFVEDRQTRRHLQQIISEENNHVTQLSAFLSREETVGDVPG